MAQTVDSVLNRVASLLADPQNITWPREELLAAYHEGLAEICGYRPDQFVTKKDFVCVRGAEQSLPSGGIRVVDIPFTVGGSRIEEKTRAHLDRIDPAWQSTVLDSYEEVDCFITDERDPKTFYLYPAPHNGYTVRLLYVAMPAAVALVNADTTDCPLDDVYINALKSFMLFRCYQQDDVPSSQSKAFSNLQLFGNLMGVKFKADQYMADSRSKGETKE